MSWFKIYERVTNLWRQPAPRNAATIEKYLPYNSPTGGYDCFPLEWDKAIRESPSASSCLSTRKDFVEGFGFSDKNLEKLVVNGKGETFWQIHHKTVNDDSEFEGVYWLLRFNALGQPTEWEVLPFENCRLGVPDDKGWISKIYYNPFFGTKDYAGAEKKKTIVYDTYNPAGLKAQIMEQKEKFKGQVLFIGSETATSRYYPMPEAYSVVDWMKIEAGVADYHEEKIDDGFLQQYILVMKGNPNEPSSNPDYQNVNDDKPATVAQVFDDYVSKNFMGRGNHSTLMVQWVDTAQGQEAPEVVTIPTAANSDLFVTLDNQAIKKITVGWNVPAILANIHEGVSLGGDGNMVRVAVKLMQQRVIKRQKRLTDAYSKILSNWVTPYRQDIAIVPYNPYPELEVIDQKIWDSLSAEERRKWVNDHTEIELIEKISQESENVSGDEQTLKAQAELRGSVGGVQGVLQIQQGVVDGTTTIQSALSILTIIYGFTNQQARRLLGQPDEPIQGETIESRLINAVPVSFPEKAREIARKALEYQEKMGIKCSGAGGRLVSQAIIENKNMPLRQLKRIYNYLKKKDKYANSAYNEGCEAILYAAWGGKEMFNFLDVKLKELDAWLN